MGLLDGGSRWDLAILHPDCTRMPLCGNRHYAVPAKRLEACLLTVEFCGLPPAYYR